MIQNQIHDSFTDNFNKLSLLTREFVKDYFFENDNTIHILINDKIQEDMIDEIVDWVKEMQVPGDMVVKISYEWMLEE